MQILKIHKSTLVFFVISLYLIHPLLARAGAKQATQWLNAPVTIRFQEKPLSGVLKELSRQTDIAILYDENLANERVTGNFKNVKASDAINRLFSKKNKSIQVSKDKKVIIVKTFGAKNFIWAGRNSLNNNDKPLPMTIEELGKMQKEQYIEYKKSIRNDNEIIKGDKNAPSMTRGEITNLHKRQYNEYKQQLQNKDFFVPNGDSNLGMTRGEILELHNKQYQQYLQQQITNKNEIVPGGKDGEGDMTIQEIKDLHVQQYNDYKSHNFNNDNIVDSNHERKAITLREIHNQYNKQYKSYKKHLQDKSRIID